MPHKKHPAKLISMAHKPGGTLYRVSATGQVSSASGHIHGNSDHPGQGSAPHLAAARQHAPSLSHAARQGSGRHRQGAGTITFEEQVAQALEQLLAAGPVHDAIATIADQVFTQRELDALYTSNAAGSFQRQGGF